MVPRWGRVSKPHQGDGHMSNRINYQREMEQVLQQLAAQGVVSNGDKSCRTLPPQARVNIIAQHTGTPGGVVVKVDRRTPSAAFEHFTKLPAKTAAAQHEDMLVLLQNRHHKNPFRLNGFVLAPV